MVNLDPVRRDPYVYGRTAVYTRHTAIREQETPDGRFKFPRGALLIS